MGESAERNPSPPVLERRDSALRQNIADKGENAYYFAHNREFVVPSDAKVVSGPGLVTGGAPTLLSAGTSSGSIGEEVGGRIEWIKDFSWADSGEKVKVYVQLPLGVLEKEDQVTVDFRTNGLDVNARATSGSVAIYRCKIDPLSADIVPDECSFRVALGKSKVTLMLKKRRDHTWYDLKKK